MKDLSGSTQGDRKVANDYESGVWLEEFGGPEALVATDSPDPVPGPGQA